MEDLENRMDPASEFFLEAEAAMLRGEHQEALDQFAKLFREHPTSCLADNALLSIATIHMNRGNMAMGQKVLTSLLKQYPDSDAAAEAKELIDEI